MHTEENWFLFLPHGVKTECITADMSRRFALAEISYIFDCEQPVVVSGHYHCDYACSMYDTLFLVGHSEVRVLAYVYVLILHTAVDELNW